MTGITFRNGLLNLCVLLAALIASSNAALGADDGPELPPAKAALRAEGETARDKSADSTRGEFDGGSARITSVFGKEGGQWWTVGASLSNDPRNNRDYGLYGAWTAFMVDNVEFTAQLNIRHFDQSGKDAQGINPVMLFRWHFYNRGNWTMFTDVGIGLLFLNHSVPEGATRFNFTPRAGGGFTRELSDNGTRLIVGLTWAHVSNARILGDRNNESRDAPQIYAGIIFPF